MTTKELVEIHQKALNLSPEMEAKLPLETYALYAAIMLTNSILIELLKNGETRNEHQTITRPRGL